MALKNKGAKKLQEMEALEALAEASSEIGIENILNEILILQDTLTIICGLLLFIVLCVLCKYVYKFFNMFF